MPQWDYVVPAALLGQQVLQTEPVDWGDAAAQTQADNNDSAAFDQFIAAARLYAENAMARTLISRQVRLIVYDTDPRCETLCLPRGPVQSIDAVTDANGAVVLASTYQLRRCGSQDYLFWRHTPAAWPPTVLYTAGYGPSGSQVPADIRQGILLHVAHLWDNRSASTTQPQTHVLAGLDAIYSSYRIGGLIG